MKVSKIDLQEGDRMIRIGFGQHKFNWFIRVDLWWAAFRLTK